MNRRLEQFDAGRGMEPPQHTCEECGYTSTNRKHFKHTESGEVCTTGHYTDGQGQPKRARNPYARR